MCKSRIPLYLLTCVFPLRFNIFLRFFSKHIILLSFYVSILFLDFSPSTLYCFPFTSQYIPRVFLQAVYIISPNKATTYLHYSVHVAQYYIRYLCTNIALVTDVYGINGHSFFPRVTEQASTCFQNNRRQTKHKTNGSF